MSNQRNVTFEDTDSGFKYIATTDWRVAPWDGIYDGTQGSFHLSDTIGAQFTFTSPSPAIAMYYFGLRRSDGAFYQACVDCDPANPAFDTIDAVNTTDDGHNSPVVLYQRTFSTAGIHTLIVQNLQDARFGKSEITVDRVVVTVQDTVSGSTSASSSVAASASTTHEGNKTSTPTGAIAGGVVGGVVLIVLVALFLWLFHCRRKASPLSRRRTLIDGPTTPVASPMQEHAAYLNVTPFSVMEVRNPNRPDVPIPRRTVSSDSVHELARSPSATSLPSSLPTRAASLQDRLTIRSPSTVKRPRGGATMSRSATMATVAETDAGPVTMNAEGAVTVPPAYDQIFGGSQSHSEL